LQYSAGYMAAVFVINIHSTAIKFIAIKKSKLS